MCYPYYWESQNRRLRQQFAKIILLSEGLTDSISKPLSEKIVVLLDNLSNNVDKLLCEIPSHSGIYMMLLLISDSGKIYAV